MKKTISTLILAFSLINFFAGAGELQAQNNADLLILNGTIVDGTGEDAYQADLLVRGDSIHTIGEISPDTLHGIRMIDASGKVVAPGFIDMHAHGNPIRTPEFESYLSMGVTTILLGQDGSSPASGSLADWFEEVEAAKPAVNVAALVGHATLRRSVGLNEDKEVFDRDIERMQAKLRADLTAGTFGMSLGLEYVPGLYAKPDELTALAKVVGEFDGIVMSHMRSEDDSRIAESLEELAELGQYARVHASHFKVVYGKGEERAEEVLNQIESYNEEGITFTADTYPYAASYTGIGIVFPTWAKTEKEWKAIMKENPTLLREFLESKVEQRNGPDAILFGSGTYAGQTLAEAAKAEGVTPIDFLLQMGPNAGSAAHFVMNEELQDRIAIADGVMISSDGSPGMRHPRGYGSFAKIIRKYVVEEQSLSIEEAVYKMSGLSVQTLGITDRGVLQTGKKADIVIFDPEQVQDNATFSSPHKPATGFEWVIVNGRVAKSGSEISKQRTGIVLRDEN
ncbi:MAG: amidohydrolase family protein [Gracilimonas sp.]|uniref:N-acyl-D-amino-acid deacylase family protein n=1 Tax=Gracilimonas TaxID=649462 RepID=UPI001B1CA15F|nr:amidohydrolase family protein [Gracilimonas sp.]MBO6586618.1 amidohydrolase family protein [Gracilimonas sp.]MBO6615275.1 amidohydrolase family protein [Gracilimonas sp.]